MLISVPSIIIVSTILSKWIKAGQSGSKIPCFSQMSQASIVWPLSNEYKWGWGHQHPIQSQNASLAWDTETSKNQCHALTLTSGVMHETSWDDDNDYNLPPLSPQSLHKQQQWVIFHPYHLFHLPLSPCSQQTNYCPHLHQRRMRELFLWLTQPLHKMDMSTSMPKYKFFLRYCTIYSMGKSSQLCTVFAQAYLV